MHVAPAPETYCESDLAGMRTTDVCSVGMLIRKPVNYTNALKNLPTGRALRRLIAKHNRKGAKQ
jgi:hypothetical protein